MPTLWTPSEERDLQLAWEDFSKLHPERTYKAWWNKRHAMCQATPTDPIEFVDRIQPLTDEQIDAYVERMLQASEVALPNGGDQAEVTAQISSQYPIGIAFTGDWHVGSRGTDLRALIAHNKLIAATPGLYVVGMGDYMHNAKANSRQADSLYRALFPNPDEQRLVALRELRRLKGKILALCRGCHDSWDIKHAGTNPLVDVAQQLDTVCLWHGGVIHLKVGSQEYHILARHRYGGSSDNSTNAQRRAWQDYPEDDRLDVVALAHLHYNDLQMRTRGKTRKVVYLRSGSYHVWDDYAQRLGGYRGEIGVPVVIFYPDERRLVPLEGSNLEQAIEILRYFRGEG